MFEKYSKGI